MTIPNFSLEGKVALVTGGRRGIGKAIALTFAGAGADVAICDIMVEGGEMEAVTEEIKKLGRRSLAVQADVTQQAQVDNLVKRVEDELGAIDILVNGVGGGGVRPQGVAAPTPTALPEIPEEDWDRGIAINLKGCFLCSQAVSKRMIERKRGNIINISSLAAERGPVSAYGIAKAGVVRLTKGLALELARYNIRANAIEPVWIKTEMTRRMWSNPEVLKQYEEKIPLGHRLGEVEDIIGPALFLASDASGFITGHAIPVDGGYLVPWP